MVRNNLEVNLTQPTTTFLGCWVRVRVRFVGGATPTTPHPLLDYDLYASPISDMGPDHFCCMGSGPGLMSVVGLVWLCWVRLGWVGLGWVRLGLVGLG